ncbi:MAG: hypothetical protein WC791_02940 [Candidatus Paceibacterota bacterium]
MKELNGGSQRLGFCVSRFRLSTFDFRLARQRGVSLLELLIYVAILSGLVVVISNVFISLSKGRGQSEARSEVDSAVRYVTDLIKQDVKNASAVSVPVLGTSSSTLSLTVGGVPVMYNVVGGALRRSENGVIATTTGSLVYVNPPVFTRLENNNNTISGIINATTTAIQVSMTMGYNASSTDWTYSETLRTTATLR